MVERPGVLRVGDRVVFAGLEQSVVALSGSSVRLVAESGESTVVALAYLLGAEDFAVVGAGPRTRVAPQGLLDVLPEKVAEAARTWERHLIEVETGLAPDAAPGTLPRSEYDPVHRSLTQRQAAKVAELGTSLRTMERMRRRYHEQGIWGLVDARYARRAKPTGNVDARVVAAAVAVIDAQTATSTGTKSRAMRRIKQILEEEHGPGTVPLPSTTTFYRLLDMLSTGRHTFGSAVTRRQTANRPAGVFTATIAARPGEQVQIDATPLDVMAFMDDGQPDRAELVAACARSVTDHVLCATDERIILEGLLHQPRCLPSWGGAAVAA